MAAVQTPEILGENPPRWREEVEKRRLIYEAHQRESHDFPLPFLTSLLAAPVSGNNTIVQGLRGNLANTEGAEQSDGGKDGLITMFPLMFPNLGTEKKSHLCDFM